MENLKQFWLQRVSELKNITWPTQKQATHSMVVVLVIMLLTGVLLGLLDFILKQGIFFLFAA